VSAVGGNTIVLARGAPGPPRARVGEPDAPLMAGAIRIGRGSWACVLPVPGAGEGSRHKTPVAGGKRNEVGPASRPPPGSLPVGRAGLQHQFLPPCKKSIAGGSFGCHRAHYHRPADQPGKSNRTDSTELFISQSGKSARAYPGLSAGLHAFPRQARLATARAAGSSETFQKGSSSI
jgi:hypothetical protein